MRGFHQAVTQPRAAFTRAPSATLTRRLVVARTHARPRCQMPSTRKAAHVTAGFRPEHLCRALAHAGNGIEPGDLLLKKGAVSPRFHH